MLIARYVRYLPKLKKKVTSSNFNVILVQIRPLDPIQKIKTNNIFIEQHQSLLHYLHLFHLVVFNFWLQFLHFFRPALYLLRCRWVLGSFGNSVDSEGLQTFRHRCATDFRVALLKSALLDAEESHNWRMQRFFQRADKIHKRRACRQWYAFGKRSTDMAWNYQICLVKLNTNTKHCNFLMDTKDSRVLFIMLYIVFYFVNTSYCSTIYFWRFDNSNLF